MALIVDYLPPVSGAPFGTEGFRAIDFETLDFEIQAPSGPPRVSRRLARERRGGIRNDLPLVRRV